MSDYRSSRDSYEDWLRRRLAGEVIESELQHKRKLMEAGPFAFLRGSYWRWAERAPDGCADLMEAPSVLAVGDVHIENFGTWRDAGHSLAWGVNDCDEAAAMPYPLDLVRLAASAALAASGDATNLPAIVPPMLGGYAAGLAAPAPTIVDEATDWLGGEVTPTKHQRHKFRDKYEAARQQPEPAPPRFQAALAAAMPEPGLAFATAPRAAGLGSRGRPRWVGIADWNDAGPDHLLVIEAKAVVTSAWELARGRPDAPVRCAEIATGRYRAADPWYRVDAGIVVRRLSTENRKIEADKDLALLLAPRMLEAMGRELAAVHAASVDAATLASDLANRRAAVSEAAGSMIAIILEDFAQA